MIRGQALLHFGAEISRFSRLAPPQVVCAPPLVSNSTWGDFAPTATTLELMEQTQRGSQAWDCADFGGDTGLGAFSPVFARAAVGASAFTSVPLPQKEIYVDNLPVRQLMIRQRHGRPIITCCLTDHKLLLLRLRSRCLQRERRLLN